MSSAKPAAEPGRQKATAGKPARWTWVALVLVALALFAMTASSELAAAARKGWRSVSAEAQSWLPEESKSLVRGHPSTFLLAVPAGEGMWDLDIDLQTDSWSKLYVLGGSVEKLCIKSYPDVGYYIRVGGKEQFFPPTEGEMRENPPLGGPFRLRGAERGQSVTFTIYPRTAP
jgi:hypothetical protein